MGTGELEVGSLEWGVERGESGMKSRESGVGSWGGDF